jgi:phosphoribosylaminoimidazole-succinocarboxamide synthase
MELKTAKYPPVWQTDIREYPLFSRGKVRDVYDLGQHLLIVATDRISAFDVIIDDPIPGKGEVLNRMSEFWFKHTADVIPNHMVTSDIYEYPEVLQRYRALLEGRSMLVKKYQRIDIECVARAYIAGSLWKEYRQKLAQAAAGPVELLGFEFPRDLKLSQRLPAVIFTPSTKAEEGHDENISYDELVAHVGPDLAGRLRRATIDVFNKCSRHAEQRGIILADTKFEFGLDGQTLVLIDEICSPDSSRFWPGDEYEIGRSQKSFDKQGVRDYLESTGWDKTPPSPKLPPEVIEATSARYAEALRRLIG